MARVRETNAMISGMKPALQPGVWHFCTCAPDQAVDLVPHALATMHEAEGLSLILPEDQAATAGLISDMAMSMITLQVHSALDGVGLTAAVAQVLTLAGIACNVVAANHHDHVFVPVKDADTAVDVLRALAMRGSA